MANENLKNMLALSKKVDELTSNGKTLPQNTKNTPTRVTTQRQLDEQIAQWDEQVFGAYQENGDKEEYSADKEMERIKQRTNENVKLNITNPILQEVFNNPYEMDVEKILEDPNMKILEDKIKGANFKGGISAAKEITETLEKVDKQKIEEKNNKQFTNGNIDYSLIKNIVESVLDEKLTSLTKQILSENTNHNKGNKTSMIMLGENFTFVDTEGNMYKCGDLHYIGKAKMKQK